MTDRIRMVEITTTKSSDDNHRLTRILYLVKHVEEVGNLGPNKLLVIFDQDIRIDDYEDSLEQILKHIKGVTAVNKIERHDLSPVGFRISQRCLEIQSELRDWMFSKKPVYTDYNSSLDFGVALTSWRILLKKVYEIKG